VALDRTLREVRGDPAAGRGRFTSVTTWERGTNALTRARHHAVRTDEPEILGGEDAAMDPMELLLAAVGSCLANGWVKHARRRDVVLRSVAVEVTAEYDLNGYLELDTSVRPGFAAIRYRLEVDCDADAAVMAEITAAAERTSPLVDNLMNATAVAGETVQRDP
jgi:uncharacterized OsmC-like protein